MLEPLLNPNLSGTLTADYVALENDLVQAQELAADFQRQLAGKSNEHAQLKQIFEKTQADLAHLQEGIVELRAERHRLANEAMRATAFQAKLAMVTAERDRLQVELEVDAAWSLDTRVEEMKPRLFCMTVTGGSRSWWWKPWSCGRNWKRRENRSAIVPLLGGHEDPIPWKCILNGRPTGSRLFARFHSPVDRQNSRPTPRFQRVE